MRVLFKNFRATFKSWEALFQEATDFASEVGPENVISISHSQNASEGIVVVWYWGEATVCDGCKYDLTGNLSGICPECGKQQSWDPPPTEPRP